MSTSDLTSTCDQTARDQRTRCRSPGLIGLRDGDLIAALEDNVWCGRVDLIPPAVFAALTELRQGRSGRFVVGTVPLPFPSRDSNAARLVNLRGQLVPAITGACHWYSTPKLEPVQRAKNAILHGSGQNTGSL